MLFSLSAFSYAVCAVVLYTSIVKHGERSFYMQIFYYLYRERIVMTSHERARALSSPTLFLLFTFLDDYVVKCEQRRQSSIGD